MTKVESLLAQIRRTYERKYLSLGTGRNRVTFQIDEQHVVKVPLSEEGINDNMWEENVFTREGRDGYIPYARCDLFYHKGVPLLRMELVDTTHVPWKNLPDWTGWVDCAQVGYAKDGKLVAYDYGCN